MGCRGLGLQFAAGLSCRLLLAATHGRIDLRMLTDVRLKKRKKDKPVETPSLKYMILAGHLPPPTFCNQCMSIGLRIEVMFSVVIISTRYPLVSA
jgi:hypothetical protein